MLIFDNQIQLIRAALNVDIKMAKSIITRNKEKTKQKLINAVGRILRKEGFHALKINRIAETAGVGKQLIYNYFNGVDGLIKAYLDQVDFWKQRKKNFNENTSTLTSSISKESMFSLLKDDFLYLEKSIEMQKVILWGISEKNTTLEKLIEEREEFGKLIFQLTDKDFKGTDIDFRAINTILVSAIYYMVLHTKTSGVKMCEIDLATEEGKSRVFKAVSQILEWCYLESANKTS